MTSMWLVSRTYPVHQLTINLPSTLTAKLSSICYIIIIVIMSYLVTNAVTDMLLTEYFKLSVLPCSVVCSLPAHCVVLPDSHLA